MPIGKYWQTYFRKHAWRKNQPVAVRVKYEGLRFDRLPTGYNHTYYRNQLDGIEPREEFNYHGKVSLISWKRQTMMNCGMGQKTSMLYKIQPQLILCHGCSSTSPKLKRAYERRYGKF